MIEELELLRNPKSRVVEAVKTVRTNLEFSSADKLCLLLLHLLKVRVSLLLV